MDTPIGVSMEGSFKLKAKPTQQRHRSKRKRVCSSVRGKLNMACFKLLVTLNMAVLNFAFHATVLCVSLHCSFYEPQWEIK